MNNAGSASKDALRPSHYLGLVPILPPRKSRPRIAAVTLGPAKCPLRTSNWQSDRAANGGVDFGERDLFDYRNFDLAR